VYTLQAATHSPESAYVADAREPKLLLTLVVTRAGRSPSAVTYVSPVPLSESEVQIIEERARELIAGRRLGPALRCPEGLTGREVEVLKLVAAGRSNQRIAEDLVISLHTVARHVSNIFDKTGAANRAEAAVYAAQNGLL
jgi:DNA-binding CsgD family transcriptional regulator